MAGRRTYRMHTDCFEKNLPQCPFSKKKLQVDWSGIEHKNLSERPATNLLKHVTPLHTEMKLNYIQRFSPYRAVDIHRLGYKNQSLNAV